MVNVSIDSNMACYSKSSSYEGDAGSFRKFGVSNYSKDCTDVMEVLILSLTLFLSVHLIYFSLYISLVISVHLCSFLVSVVFV